MMLTASPCVEKGSSISTRQHWLHTFSHIFPPHPFATEPQVVTFPASPLWWGNHEIQSWSMKLKQVFAKGFWDGICFSDRKDRQMYFPFPLSLSLQSQVIMPGASTAHLVTMRGQAKAMKGRHTAVEKHREQPVWCHGPVKPKLVTFASRFPT